ncbi:MAG: DUF302 domain-containing protein [Acidimicrobiia bacterium]|nr:DUF302 domain-containing protein [Acidimicrobiia bacterium]
MSQYTFGGVVDGDFESVREHVVEALGNEGFGVLTEIDVAATMKAKLDKDVPPYRILGACNPSLAFEAISHDPHIGALLPCNVVVRQTKTGVAVDFMDPQSVLALVGDGVGELAAEVRGRLNKVKESVLG